MVFSLLLWVLGQWSVPYFVSTEGPKVVFEKDYLNLGKIKKGETRNFEFILLNAGDEALEIRMITACECTELEWPSHPIPPGEKAVIKGVLDTAKKDFGEDTIYLEVLANTDPPITEARYDIEVIE
jgi:peptidoglycan-associated lipoprotein